MPIKLLFAFIIFVAGVSHASEPPEGSTIVTEGDAANIRHLLSNKVGYEVIEIKKSPLGLFEVHMRKVSADVKAQSGPIYFFYKEKDEWHMHKEMSEWYLK